ncbi:hypothetical protein RI367_002883 [Sorochytrium milnesiophthora]
MSDHEDYQHNHHDAEAEDDSLVNDELEAMKRRVTEMEAETAQLRELHSTVEKDVNLPPVDLAKADADARSIYVGNVDYAVTPEQLQELFQPCGAINRITIVCDKFTGHPKGFAYVEFTSTDSIAAANELNDKELNGRAIKVTPKRTNLPGLGKARGRGRGRGRGGFGYAPRGGYGAYGGAYGGGYQPYAPRGGYRGGRGGYRGARGGGFAPY